MFLDRAAPYATALNQEDSLNDTERVVTGWGQRSPGPKKRS